MLFALLVLTLISTALAMPTLLRFVEGGRRRREHLRGARRAGETADLGDPGRERRAEQRARELLRSCVNAEEWAMYRDLGFIRVRGRMLADDQASEGERAREEEHPETGTPRPRPGGRRRSGARYAYLVYPHRPVVAYVPETGRLLAEYCVEFPDLTGAINGSRLPASDDVLAKWMALTGDEERLLRSSNMHLVGHQVDPGRIRRDLWRLSQWEREWARSGGRPDGPASNSAEPQRT